MVALRSDEPRQRATNIPTRTQQLDQRYEIVARLPAELVARALIDIDPVDAGRHLPAAARIFRLEARHPPAEDLGLISAQRRHVLRREGRGRAHDVAPEAQSRRLLGSE